MIVEVGCRWEDWDSTNNLTADLDIPLLGQQDSLTIPRDWNSTWTYNAGGSYQLNEMVTLNAGYLYGQNPVPASTFEPVIPDADTHLFTLGTDLRFDDHWTVSGAFGYQYQEDRNKSNNIGDPLGSMVAGMPVDTANGEYSVELFLVALSIGYRF